MALPVLLLSGTLCDDALWAPTIRNLAPREALVGDLTHDDSIAAMADRALTIAPPRFVLIGYSLGGIVALEIQRRAPDRVAGLALVCANPGPDLHPDRAGLSLRAESGLFPDIIDEFIASYFGEPPPPGLMQQVAAMARRLGPKVFLRQNLALAGRLDSRPLLSQVRTPTLVINARQDALVTPATAAQSLAIPGAIARTVEDCGHMLPLAKPSALAACLIPWLESLDRDSAIASLEGSA